MLKVEENRSTIWLTDDESGMQICICKTRAAWEKAFESYNALVSYEKEHQTDFALADCGDTVIDLMYKAEYKNGMYRRIDGIENTDNNGKEIHPVRIGLVDSGVISDACGYVLFGNAWKIVVDEYNTYYVRDVSESYDNETDVIVNGNIVAEIA